MQRISEPEALLVGCGFVVVNTLVLLGLLSAFPPRDGGLFPGVPPRGPGVCFGASVLFSFLAVLGVPSIVSLVVWWLVALVVFRLTVRQAFKLNVAQFLVYLTLLLVLAAVVD